MFGYVHKIESYCVYGVATEILGHILNSADLDKN